MFSCFITYTCTLYTVVGHDRIWQLNLQLHMQLVPITTKVVSSDPAQARCTRYNIM